MDDFKKIGLYQLIFNKILILINISKPLFKVNSIFSF